jgi:hypothetical protein
MGGRVRATALTLTLSRRERAIDSLSPRERAGVRADGGEALHLPEDF